MLKERIAGKETIVGSFIFLSSPEMVEIMAHAGMDYVIIDTEHSPKDWDTVAHMIRAANVHKLPALVRIRENSEKLILQYLEIGADGLVIPFVQNADHVRNAAAAMYYPPHGSRGTCTLTRMTGYGAQRSQFLQYCRRQSERLVLFGQVEDRIGAENIESIVAAEPGLDAVLVGRSDLASSFGEPGNVEAAPVLEATSRIIAATSRRPSVAVAMGIYGAAEITRWRDAGCTVFFAPSDGVLAYNAARNWVEGIKGAQGADGQ